MESVTVMSILKQVRSLYPTQYVDVVVWQDPIKEIDPCPDPVRRYFGELNMCVESGQNFLDYGVFDYHCVPRNGNQIRLVVKALPNRAQIENTIFAYRNRNIYDLG